MTNSPFEIVSAGMSYMFGDDWRTLFDIIIVNAKKPSFFSHKNRPFRVYSPKSGRLKWQRVLTLEKGRIYSGVSKQNISNFAHSNNKISAMCTIFFVNEENAMLKGDISKSNMI